jgi:hypothetical protein
MKLYSDDYHGVWQRVSQVLVELVHSAAMKERNDGMKRD